VRAVGYLHHQGIAHRDLKPENILLENESEDAKVMITDFGLSKIFGDANVMKTLCGTPQYVAPEILFRMQGKQESYSKAVDLWSLGVILYILLSGSPPFYEKKENRAWMREQIQAGQFTFPKKLFKDVSPDAVDLIKRLLTVDPATRITIHETKEHPWIKDYINNEDKKPSLQAESQSDTQKEDTSSTTTITTTITITTNNSTSDAAKMDITPNTSQNDSSGTPDNNSNEKTKRTRKNSKGSITSDTSSQETNEKRASLRKRKSSETPEPVAQTPTSTKRKKK